jgi:hypothetical protein
MGNPQKLNVFSTSSAQDFDAPLFRRIYEINPKEIADSAEEKYRDGVEEVGRLRKRPVCAVRKGFHRSAR